MKLRTQKLANLAGLALALGFFAANAKAADCPDAQEIKPFMEESTLANKCGGDSSCRGYAKEIAKVMKDYDGKVAAQCGAINSGIEKLKDIKNNGTTTLKENYQGMKTENDKILSANEQANKALHRPLKEAMKHAEGMNSASADSRKTEYQTNYIEKGKSAVQNAGLVSTPLAESKISGISDPKVKAALTGPSLAADAARALERDRKHRITFGENLDTGIKNMAGAEDKMKTGDGSGDKKSGGMLDSLMNPSTLLGLAGAGASLLAAQKKNSDVSADTTPLAPVAPATPEPIQPIAPTSLTPTTLSPTKDVSGSSNQKINLANETQRQEPSITPTGATAYTPLDSGVSTKASPLNGSSSSSTPATGGSGAGAGGLASGGSSDGGSHSREPGSAGALAKGAEDSGSFGGGGGGGGGGLNFGGGASSSSSSDGSPHPEDPLRDTLHDAIAAGEGAGAITDPTQASGEVIEGESGEFLFTRVKSCIQRSVKRGLVISGLSAKIR